MMKRFVMAGVAMGIAACSVTAAMAEPTSYPLVCRGGPSMRIMVNHDVPDGVNTGATAMTVFFQAAATPGNPLPGQCVWMDRTLSPGEPQSFKLKGNVEFAFQVTGDGRLHRDTTGWRLNPEGRGLEANNWRQVVNGVLNGGLFTVQVYNAEGRTMIVTRVGP